MSATTALYATASVFVPATAVAAVYIRRLRHRLHAAMRDAHRDDLTHISNRRAFISMLRARIATDPGRISVVLIDLDRFKSINDTYGHPAGDVVLREVARRLTGIDPRLRLAARLGGDEFALIVAGDPADGLAVAKLAWQAIGNTPISIGRHHASVYACAGVASHSHGITVANLLHHADIALYHAKHAGPVASYPTARGTPPLPDRPAVRIRDQPTPPRQPPHHRRPERDAEAAAGPTDTDDKGHQP